MRDCRGCTHYRKSEDWVGKRDNPKYAHEYSKCHRIPKAFEDNYNYCSTERDMDHLCGVGAKYFAPTEVYARANALTDEFLYDDLAFWFAPDRWKGGDNLRNPKTVAFWMD